MRKINLLGYSRRQLEQLSVSLGGKPYGGRQLFKWIYKTRQYEFEHMTDLSKNLRQELIDNYIIRLPEARNIQKSSDGTIKILFLLDNDSPVETVIIPEDDKRITVCISSQAGCQLNCQFCATGKMGFKRNLSAGEIIGQLLFIKDTYGDNSFSNIVMMGMGEPLMNFENVIDAARIILDHQGLNISYRKFCISTSGIAPKIRQLADIDIKLSLAVSLHSAVNEKRSQIMPINKKYDLQELKKAIKYYTDRTGLQVMFEYILFEGFNDSSEDIRALVKLFHGLPCKINIIAYNPVEGMKFKRPNENKLDWFGGQLRKHITGVTIRKSRGIDIDAACGQLAGKIHLGVCK